MFTADTNLDLLLRTLVLGPLALLWIFALVRIVGLRSFSKMIAVDFVVTVATGSLLANAATATGWPAFLQASGAMAALLAVQAAYAFMRRKSEAAQVLENCPVILMRDGEVRPRAMADNRIAMSDLRAKLREANALDLSQVRAVVLETTGDIAVLHGDAVDDMLLEGVEDGKAQ